METISNVAAAASKAIFGEQNTAQQTTQNNETAGKEPISGQQGKGTPNEPFDQGNADDAATRAGKVTPTIPDFSNSKSASTSSGIPELSTKPDTNTLSTNITKDDSTNTHSHSESNTHSHPESSTYLPKSNYTSGTESASNYTSGTQSASNMSGADNTNPFSESSKNSSGGSNNPFSETSERSAGGNSNNPFSESRDSSTHNPINAAQGGDVDVYKNTDKTGVISGRTGDAPKAEDVFPTSRQSNPGAAPHSGAAPTFKQQGADKPLDEPTGEQHDALKEDKRTAEDFMKTKDPNDHSGEPMKMHDGSEHKNPATQEERRTSKAGQPGGQEHGKGPSGTGEQWVKTSGMAAEGGDFDATKPGAGREADRLMEEKGIKKTTSGTTPAAADNATTSHSTHASDHKEKESLGDKLKHKLHLSKK